MKTVNDAEPGTKPAPAITLTSGQENAVVRARRFLKAAAAGPHALATHLDSGTVQDVALFYAADGFGAARELLAGLLAVVGRLAAQVDQPVVNQLVAGREPLGPFETEQEALGSPAVRAIYDAMRAAPGSGVMAGRGHRLLEKACEAADVEVGAYDRRILVWLAGFEPQACAVIAGLIARGGHLAGREVADIAIIRQALADASAWRTWRTGGDCDADIEQAAAYERLLRRLVSGGAR